MPPDNNLKAADFPRANNISSREVDPGWSNTP